MLSGEVSPLLRTVISVDFWAVLWRTQLCKGVWNAGPEARQILGERKAHIRVSGSTPTPWSGPVRDRGLNPPPSTESPRNKGFSGSGAHFLDLVSQTPRPRGRGRPLFADHKTRKGGAPDRGNPKHAPCFNVALQKLC